jgi:hypothetical protein
MSDKPQPVAISSELVAISSDEIRAANDKLKLIGH